MKAAVDVEPLDFTALNEPLQLAKVDPEEQSLTVTYEVTHQPE